MVTFTDHQILNAQTVANAYPPGTRVRRLGDGVIGTVKRSSDHLHYGSREIYYDYGSVFMKHELGQVHIFVAIQWDNQRENYVGSQYPGRIEREGR